jgi:GLPGLI family protein
MRPFLLYILSFLALGMMNANAQMAVFLKQGRIEYEKRMNVHALIDAMNDGGGDNAWRDLFKKSTPKFKNSYFELRFNNYTTLYAPGRENPENNRAWQSAAEENVIYAELDKQEGTAQKRVFEQLFLVKDSTRQIRWKITDESRKIAGFDCRRANAIVMDSIYVVAFYTDAIITPGGPESFSGLPGMILGLAIPHEHITWFATKVLTEDVPAASLKAPSKGKKVNNKELLETMQKSIGKWGKYGKIYMQATML